MRRMRREIMKTIPLVPFEHAREPAPEHFLPLPRGPASSHPLSESTQVFFLLDNGKNLIQAPETYPQWTGLQVTSQLLGAGHRLNPPHQPPIAPPSAWQENALGLLNRRATQPGWIHPISRMP